MPRPRLERRMLVLTTAGLVVLIGVTVFVIASTLVQAQADDRVERERQLQVDNQQLLIGMSTQHAAIGAFLQSGRTDYLGVYGRGRVQVADAQARLSRESYDPRLRGQLRDADNAAQRWQDWAEAEKAATEVAGQPMLTSEQIVQGDQMFDLFSVADEAVTSAAQRQVAADLSASHNLRIAELAVLVGVAVLTIVIVMLISRAFLRRVLRPVTSLAETARRLAAGEALEVPVSDSTDELGELSRALSAWQAASAERLRLVEQMLETEARFRATLEHQALHDSLTNLPNRNLLEDRLEQAIRTAARTGSGLTLMFMDLDHFKEVNDTLGHAQGDRLLVQVAQRLHSALRDVDTVARLGGDEFALVLPQVSTKRGAATVARKLLRAFEEPVELETHSLAVSPSLGIAVYPEHGTDASQLMSRADAAMYAAKRSRIGFALYTRRLDAGRSDRLRLVGELKQAIASGSFELRYQPQIACATGNIVGAEALIRWRHPQRGLIPPDQFIPLAEQTGLIRPLGIWVMQEALRQADAWREQGRGLTLSVNVSVLNLQDPDFLRSIDQLLAGRSQLPGLKLEITESIMMLEPNRVLRVLEQLKALGFELAIDDFGTGHSSLAYLKRLPVDELKIDRSFVTGLSASGEDALIVKMAIELGHAFGLGVVAEGVEREGTLEELARMGCDRAQGFLLGSPTLAAELKPDADAALTAVPV